MIKNMTMMESFMAAQNDFSWLPGIEEGDLVWKREWSQSGRYSAVVQILKGQRSKVLKEAKLWKGVEGLEVVLVPYLSRAAMQLRQERTDVFRSLVESGANPKWEGSADIRYSDESGVRRLYVF